MNDNITDGTIQPVLRNYKDTIFRKLFNDKKNLLSLYNLMSGKQYTDSNMLEIVTLDNAIYMNMKNDLAFLINCSICMYEHQSSLSPNMALRYLFYVAREYEKLTNQKTIYSSKRVTLPAPHFVVFYNGKDGGEWSTRTTRLSEVFKPEEDEPNLELIVKEININLGVNDGILRQCKPLFEYMQYTDKVRTYVAYMDTALAVEKAVDESLHEGILEDFLLQNKSEAIQMSIFEFDEEREMQLIRDDERAIGFEKGIYTGIETMVRYDLTHNLTEEFIINKVTSMFDIPADVVQKMIENAAVPL